jgi:N-sulfoglucosamine sulfohydrolase
MKITFFLLFIIFPGLALAENERPNILFAFADDWGRYASIYGGDGPSSVINTPNFDRVAKEGVLFTNAHVTAPSCTPCRSSLLSGQYFWRTGRGAILQGAEWDPAIPSFPLLLKDAGYHIGKSYKVWSPGTPADAPYGGQKYAYEKAGRRFNGFSQFVTAAITKGQNIDAAKQVPYDEVKQNFDNFLADRKNGDPFCYWFGPTNVHRKWIKGSGKALWGIDPDALKGKMPAFLPDVHEVRQDLCDYLGEAMAFDVALGLLIDRITELGELDNTLIVVSGDHGAPGFTNGKTTLYNFGTGVTLAARWPAGGVKGGRTVHDFVNLMDLAPTFCEAGKVTPPDVMTGRSILNLLKSDKDGWITKDRDWVVTGRERHVAAAREDNMPYPQRAIRTKDFVYIRNFKPDRWPMGTPNAPDKIPTQNQLENDTFVAFADMDAGPTKAWLIANEKPGQPFYDFAFAKRPAEELYDLKSDPDEVKNIASDPAYADKKAELTKMLMAELSRTNDPRVKGDGSTYDKPPFAGPITASGKPNKKKK